MSASAMRLLAAAVFSDATASDREVLSRRFSIAPILARAVLTWLIAESSVEIAADAAVCVEISIDPLELDEIDVTPVSALDDRR